MSLPPVIIGLKSAYNNKYLRYRYEEGEAHGLLQFAADSITDPYAQFQVQYSKTYDGLVHLKCSFNNKYMVRWSPGHNWITASANKIDEDRNSWSCTLFRPYYIGDTHKIRMVHVQLGHYACLWRVNDPFDFCLHAGSKEIDKDLCDVFTYYSTITEGISGNTESMDGS